MVSLKRSFEFSLLITDGPKYRYMTIKLRGISGTIILLKDGYLKRSIGVNA
jgi:hypothetical protein